MRRTLPSLSVALLSTVLLAACGGGGGGEDAASQTPKQGGTLVYATGDDEPTCLDPQSRGNVPQALLGSQYLESLFYQDEKGEILPWLATAWKVADDGLSWTVDLREDVRFSDGTPFDAAAVKVNIERVLDPATQSTTGRLALSKVAKVEATGEFTVRIDLRQPDGALLESLSQVWLPMESPTALKRSLEENCAAPVGTGPFKIESWTKQDNVTLVRNESYSTPPPGASHSGPAYLDKIVWRFVQDGTSRFAALQSGQVNVVDVLEPQNAVAAANVPTLKTLIQARPGEPVEIKLNIGRAPFDDAKVREAFFSSIDVAGALSSVYLGTVEQAKSPLSSATRYRADTVKHAYDPDAAAKLLDEAGWTAKDANGFRTKDGKTLTVTLPYANAIPLEPGFYEQVQATAKKVGFDVKLEPLETAKWWVKNYNWDYDAIPIYYTKNSADVLRITSTAAANAEDTPGGYHANNVRLKSAELDAILEKAGESSDDAERADLYRQAQQFLSDGHYVLPIYDQQTRLGYQSKVRGLRLLPSLSMPYFYDTWIDD
ncbi:ABC transporter substrate-binding protein [Actinocorallia sp. A-T 12471]|uniref:ABC transporter substrate-binding protein n=1 Tax=Actinocorallia sp. A-T 12471 TaxID=3089813 RepID=UPI0029D1E798|nr:ABC transporter substrate-binding protein [Actinocorallia sp. A-T 12471]MDX6742319.1 ABC transporter substrate-binding protein [Actinocorallia sp. A-T 12471]